MSIIFIADDFPPEVGGIQTYACELARETAELGEEVAVVASRQEDGEQFDAGLPCLTVRVPTGASPPMAAMNLAEGTRYLAAELETPLQCVIATKWSPEGIAAILARGQLRRPLALIGHGGEFSHSGGSPIKWLVQRVVRRRMSLCLANSGFTAELFRKAGVPEERIGIIYAGVNPERFDVGHDAARSARDELDVGDRPLLLTVARLVERKGHDTVLAALPAVLEETPELLYVIAGEGPMREELERGVREAGLEDSVLMLGEVEHRRLPALYAAAQVFVMPSRQVRGQLPEGFGLAFLEAAAAGTPSIATDFGGIPDAIADGETGLLVDPGDPEALAVAINRMLGDDALRRQMGDAARDRALAEFTWRRVAERLLGELSRFEQEGATSG